MRLFYASFLSPENVSAYESLVADVATEVPNAIRPVPAGTQHLTLAFLGEIAGEDLRTCEETLAVTVELAAIPIVLGPPTILFARRTPRLVCVGVDEGRNRIADLQEVLRRALVESLPELDLRPKPPHVTLARFRKNTDRTTARRVEEALSRREAPSPARTDFLSRVHLVRSRLTPRGPLYERLAEAVLAEGPSPTP